VRENVERRAGRCAPAASSGRALGSGDPQQNLTEILRTAAVIKYLNHIRSRDKTTTALAGQQDRVEAEGVLDRSEVWWLRLREIIRTGSLKPGDFVLSSGHTNTF
jgi:hypothetical protein